MEHPRAATPHLRLVRPADGTAHSPGPAARPTVQFDRLAGAGRPAARQTARAVERENRAAAAFAAEDARTIFAAQVARRLEGGRAAILPAEARERLLAAARRMGIRPFDAALVIAIVQDGARRGEADVVERAGALVASAPWGSASPRDAEANHDRVVRWATVGFTALALAGAIVCLLIGWVSGAGA